MIPLKEFRMRRLHGTLTQSLAELTFFQLFEQWTNYHGTMTNAEAAGYPNEARIWRDIVGMIKANEIMDEFIVNNSVVTLVNDQGDL
jgi:hypothetical protein